MSKARVIKDVEDLELNREYIYIGKTIWNEYAVITFVGTFNYYRELLPVFVHQDADGVLHSSTVMLDFCGEHQVLEV